MVGRPLAPWTAKVVEMLTPPDGMSPEWVDFKVLLDAAAPYIPDERASKTMEQRDFLNLTSARRDIISTSIGVLIRSKKVEVIYIEQPHRIFDKVRLTQKGVTNKPALKSNTHPWTTKIIEILQDNEWHPYDEILDLTSPMVPPGMAWRQAEESRLRHYQKRGTPPGERTRGGRNDTIKSGQRYYINRAVKSLRHTGRIEVEYGTQEIRKRPTRIRLIQ